MPKFAQDSPKTRERRPKERGWLSRSLGKVSDVAVFAWWVVSGMPEEETARGLAGRRGRQQVPTILLARPRPRDGDRDHTPQLASPQSPQHKGSASPPAHSPYGISPSRINEDGKLEYDDEVQANIRWIRLRMCAFRARVCVRVHARACVCT
jgi:hypothetical protein